jgi:tRNA U34 2-thiouridine synthase MnmA/TrmU
MSVAKFVYVDYFVIVLTETKEKKKIVALLSGGLDSTLAIKTMQKQGFEVSAVAIKTPFCDFDCGRGCGLLPATDPEKNGLIKRKDLGMIRGRSRKEQLQMAQEFGIEDPPNAGGGCLLTDPAFSLRAIDLFKHIETPTTNDIDLLKIGRHFRLDQNTKLIVGRNKNENEMMHALALSNDIMLEAKEHVGPTTLLRGSNIGKHIKFSAEITLRYSDAPKNKAGVVSVHKNDNITEVSVDCAEEISYTPFRI